MGVHFCDVYDATDTSIQLILSVTRHCVSAKRTGVPVDGTKPTGEAELWLHSFVIYA